MRFRTEYPVKRSDLTVSVERPVLLVGSCFSDNITRRMRECLWDGRNPFGVLYNPMSIAKALELALYDPDPYTKVKESLFESDGITNSWLFSSRMSREFRSDAYEVAIRRLTEARETMDKGKTLIVTFGTSWCYYLHEKNDYVVGNCHRQPSALFERRRVSVGEIVDVWTHVLEELRLRYPGTNVIFTVSPIRHLKDGFEGNSRSKAVLLLAVEELCVRFGCCRYFPAFEILNDDLRDYRFYDSDLVHPSEEAADYIWDIFKSTYLTQEDMAVLKEGEGILRAWRHRPMLEGRKSELMEYRESLRRYEIGERWNAFYEKHPNAVFYQDV